MKTAEVLSDLTSLRVCDPSAALTLVKARPESSPEAKQSPEKPGNATDPDTARAKDLVELHYAVKVAAQENELSQELADARDNARRAMAGL
ncbi:MAG: hypothetical protein M1820_002905 [Bogoriella megaspora]|nr:MAG: hypothetical protein M1820_002905 [Bogoriella megaspora]